MVQAVTAVQAKRRYECGRDAAGTSGRLCYWYRTLLVAAVAIAVGWPVVSLEINKVVSGELVRGALLMAIGAPGVHAGITGVARLFRNPNWPLTNADGRRLLSVDRSASCDGSLADSGRYSPYKVRFRSTPPTGIFLGPWPLDLREDCSSFPPGRRHKWTRGSKVVPFRGTGASSGTVVE